VGFAFVDLDLVLVFLTDVGLSVGFALVGFGVAVFLEVGVAFTVVFLCVGVDFTVVFLCVGVDFTVVFLCVGVDFTVVFLCVGIAFTVVFLCVVFFGVACTLAKASVTYFG
jgi:hypothetical protein